MTVSEQVGRNLRKARRRPLMSQEDHRRGHRTHRKVKKNLKKVRAAMDWIAKKEEGKTPHERPIWVTEIGFPVHTESDEAAEDHHHLLVSEQVQAELLTHVFNMMKNKSGSESERASTSAGRSTTTFKTMSTVSIPHGTIGAGYVKTTWKIT